MSTAKTCPDCSLLLARCDFKFCPDCGAKLEQKPSDKAPVETFTDSQIRSALSAFLEYGEQSYRPDCADHDVGHRGYFSGPGWAARCLRYHLDNLRSNQIPSGGGGR